MCANWTCQERSFEHRKCVCVCRNVCVGACEPDCYVRRNNYLYLYPHHAGNRVVFVGINHCVSLAIPSLPSLPFPPGTSSHTKYRAARDEEERKEVLVQSEMQMATEDMSTSQSGTRTTSSCQFIHNKSNATP